MNVKNSMTVITDSDIIIYYTSFLCEDGFLILYNGNKYLYTDKRYYYSAVNNANAICRLLDNNSLELFIKENNISSVGIIDNFTSVDFYKKLISFGVEVYDDTATINSQLSVKTDREIALIKNSCKVLEKALKNALTSLKVGITEREFAGILEYNFKLYGGDKPSFETIVAFGEGSAIPHYKTGDVKLKENTPVLIDCGTVVSGYASDITRSFYYGIAPNEYKRAFDAVLKAHETAFNKITLGMTGKDADGIARAVLDSYGYSEYFTHSLGHGVGVKVHEAPYLSPKSTSVLVNNNVFSIEPGVYFDGKFGIRIEDTVYLNNGKCESFFNLRKDVVEFNPTQKIDI